MSAEAINQLYIETYGRPASQAEIDYHANRFGDELDPIESQALKGEMTSVAGYTPPQTTADAGVDGTPPSQPPEAPAEATSNFVPGAGAVEPPPTTPTTQQDQLKSQLDDLYQKTYNRPATDEEVSYYRNVYGGKLDDIERKDLFGRMLQGSGDQSVNLYRDILGRDPESPEAMQAARNLTRQDFFQRALPELRQTSPVFSTFQQVLGRDPGLAGLEYYRNVRPDLMQDPRAFRQAAIQSGEFGNRLRDLYRQNMGYDPSAQAYQGLMQSGTFLNPYEFRGSIARQNIAMRPRYSDYGYNPYAQNFMNQYQPQPMYQPPTPPRSDFFNRSYGRMGRMEVTPPEGSRGMQPPQSFSGIGGKGGQPIQQQPSPMGGGKGGRPSGTIGMGAASAGIGGKR